MDCEYPFDLQIEENRNELGNFFLGKEAIDETKGSIF